MLVGLEGTLNVFKWAGRHQIRVLYVSSSEIYGNPSVHPQSENYWGYTNSVGMRSPYVEAKRAGEALCRSFRLEKNLSIRVARLFNVYGPGFRADDSRVVPQFIQAAEAGDPLTIYGTGECTRSFCYVTDIVDGLLRLMEKDMEGIEEPVNLGFPEEIDIQKLAKIVIDSTGSKSKVLCVNPICEDLPRRLPDISKAKKYLEWSPKIGIEEGIELTVRWFRQMLIVRQTVQSAQRSE
jgi:nucleoside-diphosphate-sugar epimerase